MLTRISRRCPPPSPGGAADGQQTPQPPVADVDPARIRNEKDLERYQSIFADVAFWKKLGEEYQGPLIITGTVLFSPLSTAGYVPVEQEYFDQLGRRPPLGRPLLREEGRGTQP